jgi:hypothetical protein
VSLLILATFNWVHVKVKPVPSLNLLLINIKNFMNISKGDSKVNTLEVDMENQIYNSLINTSKAINNVLPKKLQSQLLLIPIAILLLLLFI